MMNQVKNQSRLWKIQSASFQSGKRLLIWVAVLVLTVQAGELKSEEQNFAAAAPLISSSTEWSFNEYWKQRKIGDKDFYMESYATYYWMVCYDKLKQMGLLTRVTPGTLSSSWRNLEGFNPAVTPTLDARGQEMVALFLSNRWPILSGQLCSTRGAKPAGEAARKAVDDLWLGDTNAEGPYRLEPIFHYLKTGKVWRGSSSDTWTDKAGEEFLGKRVIPLAEKELPFIRDPNHQWTRKELRKLCDIYCNEYNRPEGRVVPFGMWLSPYAVASSPECKMAVAEKGADALANARGRGMMRQTGGNKFFHVHRGYEPLNRYYYDCHASTTTVSELWGFPLPHIWYYIYRPYLIGANQYVNENFPYTFIADIEGDGQYELATPGHILKDMLDFADRHPDRGVAYAPVALLMDYNRGEELTRGDFLGFKLPTPDDADEMNSGIYGLLFPTHRHTQGSYDYSKTAPYGEIFDILAPNLPDKPVDAKALENYKMLFAMGGLEVDEDFAQKLMDHVKKGGTLVINAADVGKNLPADFLGVDISTDTFDAKETACAVCGKKFAEEEFSSHRLKLSTGSEAVMTGQDGQALVSKHRYGKGIVIAVGVQYLIQKNTEETKNPVVGRKPVKKKSLLKTTPHLFDHLFVGLTPVEVLRREEDREDLSWIIAKKGEGWVVTMFNYSLLKEPLVVRVPSALTVLAEYPYREVPFQIVCRAPVQDVMEWYQDRDVKWEIKDKTAVISETMHGGEIRVYELQPKKIEIGSRTRYVNYALNKPVTASSTLKGYVNFSRTITPVLGNAPERAVDGEPDNDKYWRSDTDAKNHGVFDMPQWLQVDLGEKKTIDHVFVKFYHWPYESLECFETRQHIYQYFVEASEDGKEWRKVLDESKNMKPADLWGLERWFEPVQARYVKLTVLYATDLGGARVVEFQVMGAERETYAPQRKSIVPLWQVRYPAAVQAAAADKILYLIDLPAQKKPMPPPWAAGKTWEQMNGTVKLMTSPRKDGAEFPKSLFAEAPSEIVYQIPPGYATFAAAAGLGSERLEEAVIFKVLVDGKEKFKSDVFRLGQPVLPVLVDIRNARELTLIVEDPHGRNSSYAWWGEARLIRK